MNALTNRIDSVLPIAFRRDLREEKLVYRVPLSSRTTAHERQRWLAYLEKDDQITLHVEGSAIAPEVEVGHSFQGSLPIRHVGPSVRFRVEADGVHYLLFRGGDVETFVRITRRRTVRGPRGRVLRRTLTWLARRSKAGHAAPGSRPDSPEAA